MNWLKKHWLPLSLIISISVLAGIALGQTVGSAVPSTAQLAGGKDSSGNLAGMRVCDQRAAILVSAATIQQISAGAANKKFYVCGFHVISNTATTIKFVEGTTATCTTSPSDVTGYAPVSANGGFSLPISTYAAPFTNVTGNNLCVWANATTSLGGWISYTLQ